MLILAIDSSGRNGSLALARYTPAVAHGVSIDAAQMEIVEFALLQGGEYSARLIPTLAEAVEKHKLAKQDIDLYVVASGPGSFTGLRVGLSTVKAMADALGKPIAAVSVLEAVAIASRNRLQENKGRVIAALDAQRGEVFAGEYTISDEFGPFPVRTEQESLSTVDDFCTWLSARVPVPVTFTPEAALVERIRKAGSPAEELPRPAADLYARAGLMKFAAGQTITAAALDANYIRRADAQMLSSAQAVSSRPGTK